MKLPKTLLLLSQIVAPCLATLSITLAPEEEFCFAFRTPKGQPAHITGSYDMMNDALPAEPLTAIIFDYENEKVTWHNTFGKSEGHFSLTGSGKFHYCFGNGSGGYKTEDEKESRDNKKLQGHPLDDDNHFDYENYDGELRTIGFTLRIRPVEGTEAARLMEVNTQTGNAADIQNNKLTDLSNTMRDKMELLLDHQEYIKNREATHRHVVENTFTMVMKWTLLETFVLTCVAAAQVLYLKRFFETKRYL